MKIFTLKISFLISTLCCLCFAQRADAAGFRAKQETAVQKSMALMTDLSTYMATCAETFTIKGFEASLQRKLSIKEKLMLRFYLKRGVSQTAAAFDDDEAKVRNQTLGWISMGLGAFGFMLIFVPFAGLLSLLLWPAAAVTGIIVLSRAKRFSDRENSGFGLGLAGLITGGVGMFLILIGLAILIGFAQ